MILNKIYKTFFKQGRALKGIYNKVFLKDILIFVLLLSFLNLGNSGSWYFSDSARDLEEVFGMVSGDWRLLGPKLSFFGLFSGPYYYYYLFPIVKFFANTPHIIIIVHTIVVSLLMMALLKLILKQYGKSTYLFLLFIVTTPSVFFASRNISNGLFIMIPFLLSILLLLKDKTNWKVELLIGLLAGIMVNSHPITFLGAGELWLLLLFRSKEKLQTSMRFFSFFSITFLPLLAFEIKHDWILLKSIDISQIGVNVKDWRSFINERISIWPHLVNIFMWIVLFFHSLKNSDISLKLKNQLFSVLYFNLLVIFLILFYRPSSYYLFIYLWLVMLLSGYVILRTGQQNNIQLLFCFINIGLVILLIGNSGNSYNPNWYRQKVNNVIDKGWFDEEKKTNFMFIRNSYSTAPQGYEFRYFAKIMEKNILPIDDFANTEKLIIFSENSEYDFHEEKSFEMSQFKTTKTQLIDKFTDGEIAYFLLKK